MIKKINILPITLAVMFMTSCANDDTVSSGQGEVGQEICFASTGDAVVSRAGGTDPLNSLAKDFTVYGINGTVSGSTFTKSDLVFDNYVVWYKESSANTTTTNTSNWEYVGTHPTGDLYSTTGIDNVQYQRVKYWDYSKDVHYFWGIAMADKGKFMSKGAGTAAPQAADGYATFNTDGTIATYVKKFTSASDAANFFYSDPVKVEKANYGSVVKLNFKTMVCYVRVGMYETIPGYVVDGITFYGDAGSSNSLQLNNSVATFADEGVVTITYDNEDQTVSTAIEGGTSAAKSCSFGALAYQKQTVKTLTGNYLAQSSATPSYAGGTKTCFPNTTRNTPFSIMCDYTIHNVQTGETISIKGASATVPAEYCAWYPNYSYTYIFKLTSDTYKPIQFDAYVAEEIEQGTTSLVNDYTITTSQDGDVDDGMVKYKIGKAITITVTNAGTKLELTDSNLTVTGSKTVTTTAVDSYTRTFTPTATGDYTIEYTTTTGKVTQVITVE